MKKETINLFKVRMSKEASVEASKILNSGYIGQGPVVDQLVFHLDNLKMELGDRLEKQRFDIITHKTPEQYNITDDELKSSEESKDET